jgi:Putative S-adenosyl-L-methionine-dependent methyltransferase
MFDALVKAQYDAFEDELDEIKPNDTRQMWHTPTEVFQPYYGEALARYMATNYKVSLYPYYDLVIYEMGAGNGTLMRNVLDYLRDNAPEVYERTQYKIIEISPSLAKIQSTKVQEALSSEGHGSRVEIINKSIFDWEQYVASPCFFVALEVFDNFAHDCLRYDPDTGEALQANVIIDSNGEIFETYSKKLDPIALRFLQIRDMVATNAYRLPNTFTPGKTLWTNESGTDVKITAPEYIPTRLMQFFDVLHNYFPGHRLISADFDNLPSVAAGQTAPVVQTRYKREMVQVTTPLVSLSHTIFYY